MNHTNVGTRLLTEKEIRESYYRKYWASWYHYEEMGDFEFKDDYPCWESGFMPLNNPDSVTGQFIDCATIYVVAIKTGCLNDVRKIIGSSYVEFVGFPDIRFVIQKPDDWSPFTDRFPRADWMVWG